MTTFITLKAYSSDELDSLITTSELNGWSRYGARYQARTGRWTQAMLKGVQEPATSAKREYILAAGDDSATN